MHSDACGRAAKTGSMSQGESVLPVKVTSKGSPATDVLTAARHFCPPWLATTCTFKGAGIHAMRQCGRAARASSAERRRREKKRSMPRGEVFGE